MPTFIILREIWKKKTVIFFIRKGPPYDFRVKNHSSQNPNFFFKNQNVWKYHAESRLQNCGNLISLFVISKQSQPDPYGTHCTIFSYNTKKANFDS